MRRGMAGILGLVQAGNGAWMLIAPGGWYAAVPGVAEQGPMNVHFVQDVGAAFLVAGVGLLLRAVVPALWPAAMAGAAFLAVHAGLHLVGMSSGHAGVTDLALVVAPAALALVAAMPGGSRLGRGLALAGVGAFERRYSYDAAYMRAMIAHAPGAFYRFAAILLPAGYRSAAPADAYFAAKLVGAMTEDCGPCAQLVADLAAEAGVAPGQIEAVLTRDAARMDPGTALGFRLADAVSRRDLEAADAARGEVRAALGEAALVELTLGYAVGRVFPATKSMLGHARSCQLVRVGGQAVAVLAR
jgi:hypothetical protein